MSSSTPTSRFVSAHFRAQLACVLLVLCGLMSLILLALHLLMLGTLGGASADVAALEGGASIGEVLIGLAALGYLCVFITSAVTFLMWLHRAYANLRPLAGRTETTPGWAVGYWFIPFANLVRPYQAVKELWIKSDPAVDFSKGFASARDGARATTLLGIWWGFWILSNFADRVYSRVDLKGEAGQVSEAAVWVAVGSNSLTVAAALFAVLVVRNIDQMQSEKSRRRGYDLWSPPPPPPDSFGPKPSGETV